MTELSLEPVDDRQLQAGVQHARPRTQPMSVADVTGSLFAAYRVDDGQVHLAGCQLTDHPFLRLTFSNREGGPSAEPGSGYSAPRLGGSLALSELSRHEVRHIYVAPDGSSVSDELVPRLGLDELEPISKLPPRLDDNALRALISAGKRIATKQSAERDPGAAALEPLAVTVVWVRHAEGRLQFTIGKQTAYLPFSSWAKLLKAQPFVAKGSGASTFHLAATDDGRIDAAEEVATCEESGRRVLRQELLECSVTGKRVLADFTEACPVSGRPALRHEFVSCTVCKQHVSKRVMEAGACEACRSLAKASKDDPRLVWIFAEHPGLDRWKHWQLAETQDVYIAEATSLLKRLLIVVDKESLAVHRLATTSRLSSTWLEASDAERGDLLK
jgi:hypothetical protein